MGLLSVIPSFFVQFGFNLGDWKLSTLQQIGFGGWFCRLINLLLLYINPLSLHKTWLGRFVLVFLVSFL